MLYRFIISIICILTASFALSIILILVGVAVGTVRSQDIGDETLSLADILPAAQDLVVQGIIDLGIMLQIATPLIYVVASLAISLRQRDLVFISIGLALIVMLSTNVGVALL